MATAPPPAGMGADRRVTSLLAVAMLAAAVIPRLIPDLPGLGAIGPLASALLWLPPALWLAAFVADDHRPGIAWHLRLLARLSVWVPVAAVLLDPGHNLPDIVAATIGSAVDAAAGEVQAVVASVAGLLVVGVILAVLMGGTTETATPPAERRVVQTGSSIHPVVAFLLRLTLRLVARLGLAVIGLALLLAAWTVDGRPGIRALRRDDPPRAGRPRCSPPRTGVAGRG